VFTATVPVWHAFGGAATFSFGDDPKDPPITVTKTDGGTVRGKLLAYDRDKVTLEVAGKPNEPPMTLEIPWDQIKRVSSGLTREKAIQKWKAEHRDQLCQTCHGDGSVFCPTCHGTARDPAASTDCATCKGAAKAACKTPRCADGKIPCPDKCLKITDPGWTKRPDGTRWKKIRMKNGATAEVSEGHVGEIVELRDGVPTLAGKCPTCGGATTLIDPKCRGTGSEPCPACAKRRDAAPCQTGCGDGLAECPACRGTGAKV
jgi:hypothetical protein